MPPLSEMAFRSAPSKALWPMENWVALQIGIGSTRVADDLIGSTRLVAYTRLVATVAGIRTICDAATGAAVAVRAGTAAGITQATAIAIACCAAIATAAVIVAAVACGTPAAAVLVLHTDAVFYIVHTHDAFHQVFGMALFGTAAYGTGKHYLVAFYFYFNIRSVQMAIISQAFANVLTNAVFGALVTTWPFTKMLAAAAVIVAMVATGHAAVATAVIVIAEPAFHFVFGAIPPAVIVVIVVTAVAVKPVAVAYVLAGALVTLMAIVALLSIIATGVAVAALLAIAHIGTAVVAAAHILARRAIAVPRAITTTGIAYLTVAAGVIIVALVALEHTALVTLAAIIVTTGPVGFFFTLAQVAMIHFAITRVWGIALLHVVVGVHVAAFTPLILLATLLVPTRLLTILVALLPVVVHNKLFKGE